MGRIVDQFGDVYPSHTIITGPGLTVSQDENGVTTLNAGGTKLIYVTFDGLPNTDVEAGMFAKVLPLGIPGTLTRVRVTSDVDCDAEFSVWKDILANGDPTIADDIVGTTPPGLSASKFYEDSTLTGWDTDVALTDVWLIKIASIDIGVRWIQLQLEITT
jgi:hypothetical protein